MRNLTTKASLALILGMGLTYVALGLLSLFTAGLPLAHAASGDVYCVTPGGGSFAECDQVFTTIQAAVDAATGGEEIRVASGTYTDLHVRPRNDFTTTGVVTQVVYISQSVTIRGGYTTPFTDTPDPVANPTTLDAQGQGRVLYITGDISPTIEGLRINGGYNNGLGGDPSADRDAGGGIYVITATVNIINSQISSSTSRLLGVGGGLAFLNSANVTLTGNTIISNTACALAGGIYFRDSSGASLTANVVHNNLANCPGGGMKHNGGIHFLSSDDATLVNNTISGNRAANTCGGLYIRASNNAILIGNKVISNSAGSPGFASSGGGICLESSYEATLMNNLITGNHTFGEGGGLLQVRGSMTLINNVVSDNNAGNLGSGLYISGASPALLHNTIARNTGGDGSGVNITDIFGTFSTVAMTNTILVSQTVGITVTASNTATLNGVLWHNNTANTGGAGTITVMNEYSGDPTFAADGYHLRCGSAAINRGVDADITTDIDGNQRPQGSAPDLGADELSCLYLPIILKNNG